MDEDVCGLVCEDVCDGCPVMSVRLCLRLSVSMSVGLSVRLSVKVFFWLSLRLLICKSGCL